MSFSHWSGGIRPLQFAKTTGGRSVRSVLSFAADRMTVRRAVKLRCQIVTESDFRLLGTEATDVSTGGLLVPSKEFVSSGESVLIALKLPRTGSWVDIEGTVVRTIEGRRESDQDRAIGIRFDKIDMLSRVMLSAGLVGNPPPVPTRNVRKDYAAAVWRIAAGLA